VSVGRFAGENFRIQKALNMVSKVYSNKFYFGIFIFLFLLKIFFDLYA